MPKSHKLTTMPDCELFGVAFVGLMKLSAGDVAQEFSASCVTVRWGGICVSKLEDLVRRVVLLGSTDCSRQRVPLLRR